MSTPTVQLKNKFDAVTIAKIKKSAKLALAGVLIVILPAFSSMLVSWLTKDNPIDWMKLGALSLSAISAFLVNTLREYKAGKTEEEGFTKAGEKTE